MIETRVGYSKDVIRMFLSSRRFLLEAAVETTLPDADFPRLLETVRGKSLSKHRAHMANLVRTHIPVEVVSFYGLKKYSAEWWSAIVKMEIPTLSPNKDTQYLILVGWCNKIHGTKAIASSFASNITEALQIVTTKKEEKEIKGYEEDILFENIFLTESKPLPPLPGLEEGKVSIPRELDPETSLHVGLSGLEDFGISPLPRHHPEPKPKKKRRVRGKKEETSKATKGEESDTTSEKKSDKKKLMAIMRKRKKKSTW